MVKISDLKILIDPELNLNSSSFASQLAAFTSGKNIPKIKLEVSEINGSKATSNLKKQIEGSFNGFKISVNPTIKSNNEWQSRFKETLKNSTAKNIDIKPLQNQLKQFEKTSSVYGANGNFSNVLESYRNGLSSLGSEAEQLRPKFETLENATKELQKALSDPTKSASDISKQTEAIEKLNQEYKHLYTTAKKNQETSFTTAKDINDLKDLINTIEKYGQVNDRLFKNQSLGSSYTSLLSKSRDTLASNSFNGVDIKNLRSELRGLQIDARKAGLEGQTLFTRLGEQASKFGVYISATTVMMGAGRQIQQMVQNVVTLDKSLTDLQIATGYTREETRGLISDYSEMGKVLGASTVDVATAADTWLRQGFSINETNTLIKNSMMLSKLGQIDSDAATQALTSSMKGYNVAVEDSISIVDKFSAVDMTAAVSAGYIATALAETATSARLAGVDLNKVVGYIAAIGETTQDGAESVGNFAKTLFARMGNVKEGRLFDPETSEDLSSVETVLSGLGIKLRENGGEFRNFGEVLDEVAAKWKTYGSVNQRAIAVAFSGYRVA